MKANAKLKCMSGAALREVLYLFKSDDLRKLAKKYGFSNKQLRNKRNIISCLYQNSSLLDEVVTITMLGVKQ